MTCGGRPSPPHSDAPSGVPSESLPSPPGQVWLLGRLRPLRALGLEASRAGCQAERALSLGRRGTCQSDPSKGLRRWELRPSLPPIIFFCLPSLAPFLRLPCSPSSPPPSSSPAPALPFLPALSTPALSGAGISPPRAEAPSRARAARVPGKRCGDPTDRALGWEAALGRGRPRSGGPGRQPPRGAAGRARRRGGGRDPSAPGAASRGPRPGPAEPQ